MWRKVNNIAFLYFWRHKRQDERFVVRSSLQTGGDDDNIATYMLYREKQLLDAWCIIVGPYTNNWAVGEIDKPFKLTLSPQAGYDQEKTAKQIGERLRDLMHEKEIYLGELSRKTGLSPDDIHHMMNDHPVTPNIEQLECIARVLGVRASDILPF